MTGMIQCQDSSREEEEAHPKRYSTLTTIMTHATRGATRHPATTLARTTSAVALPSSTRELVRPTTTTVEVLLQCTQGMDHQLDPHQATPLGTHQAEEVAEVADQDHSQEEAQGTEETHAASTCLTDQATTPEIAHSEWTSSVTNPLRSSTTVPPTKSTGRELTVPPRTAETPGTSLKVCNRETDEPIFVHSLPE